MRSLGVETFSATPAGHDSGKISLQTFSDEA